MEEDEEEVEVGVEVLFVEAIAASGLEEGAMSCGDWRRAPP